MLPLCFLKGDNIVRSQRISLVFSFASSICIIIISIARSVFLLLPSGAATSVVLAHVRIRSFSVHGWGRMTFILAFPRRHLRSSSVTSSSCRSCIIICCVTGATSIWMAFNSQASSPFPPESEYRWRSSLDVLAWDPSSSTSLYSSCQY